MHTNFVRLYEVTCPLCHALLLDQQHRMNDHGVRVANPSGYATIQLQGEWNGTRMDIHTHSSYGVHATDGYGLVPNGEEIKISCPHCSASLLVGTKCSCGASMFQLSAVQRDPQSRTTLVIACCRKGCNRHTLRPMSVDTSFVEGFAADRELHDDRFAAAAALA